METIGQRIRELRKELNLTQPELADKIGVAKSVISFWENNINIPRADYIAKLSKIFDVSADYLLGNANDSYIREKINDSLPLEPPNKTVAFVNEYGELIDDGNFQNIAKLCRNITPELRALALGYLVGLLQNNGVNTKKILGY